MTDSIIRECHVPHHGPCDAVLSPEATMATLKDHGFSARIVRDMREGDGPTQQVEAWEPATIIPLNGGPVVDASMWVTVPQGVHALAAWLGY